MSTLAVCEGCMASGWQPGWKYDHRARQWLCTRCVASAIGFAQADEARLIEWIREAIEAKLDPDLARWVRARAK